MRHAVVIVALLAVCEPAVAAPSDNERAAYAKAKPVFDKYCAKCHVRGGEKATVKKLAHFDMTSYPFRGHHTSSMGPTMAKVLGLTGKKPTMPSDKKGAVQGEELALIKAWIDAWRAAHPGKSRGHHHH